MLICCTKKLQEAVGIKPEVISEENDLFCWSAHVLTIMRRKAVAVFNDSNRFGFVLYGLKAKDFKNLETLILQGIKRCLLNEKVKEKIVEKYLSMAGEVHFSKTRGPKYVSRINKACEFLPYLEDSIDLKELYQVQMTNQINHDLVKVDSKNNYCRPFELLVNDLKNAFGEDIIQCEACEILIKLDLGVYVAERRIIAPTDMTFQELHTMIQGAFGWRNSHLHVFNIFSEKDEFITKIVSNYDELMDVQLDNNIVVEDEVSISDYVRNRNKIFYVYDFGDNWEHEIIVENLISDYDKGYPSCRGGMGDTPPEDVGGVPGYEEFYEIINNPEHPEYEDTKTWAGSLWGKKFDIDLINRFLKKL
jgi:hypothetical protein